MGLALPLTRGSYDGYSGGGGGGTYLYISNNILAVELKKENRKYTYARDVSALRLETLLLLLLSLFYY